MLVFSSWSHWWTLSLAHQIHLLRDKYLKAKDIFPWHFINNHIALMYFPQDTRKTWNLWAVSGGCTLGQKTQTEGGKCAITDSMNWISSILGSSFSLVYCTQPKPATVKNQFPKNNHAAKNTNARNTVGLHTWRG